MHENKKIDTRGPTGCKFQFSIGDAKTHLAGHIAKWLSDQFQFSIGDATPRRRGGESQQCCCYSFNSLLEMLAKKKCPYCGDEVNDKVSILYWRCPVGCIRHSTDGGKLVSILYWRCDAVWGWAGWMGMSETFQFSIGDAILPMCRRTEYTTSPVSILYWRCRRPGRHAQQVHKTRFQFSIGDAYSINCGVV